jgi:DNA (cytosine-5)-methyltransferase 1
MRAGSLFTGYGGLDMAATAVLGCDTAWVCEVDPAAAALLAHRYPGVPNLGDITAVDWTQVEPVDVLVGGFPCQDISNAGKRAGIEGERSGLWSYFADAIRVLRPRYVLIENVSALVVRGLDRVLTDLAAYGFDAEWATVRASDVGAPHGRARVFIAATQDTDGAVGRERRDAAPEQTESRGAWADAGRRGRAPLAHAAGDGRHEGRPEPTRLERGPDAAQRGAPTPDADSDAVREQPEPLEWRGGTAIAGQPGRIDWGQYTPAIRLWERILGRPAPAPVVTGARGGRVLNPALPEFMMGLPDGWITAVPGLSRNAQLRLAGNGVVPQQAAAAFAHLIPLLTSQECAA